MSDATPKRTPFDDWLRQHRLTNQDAADTFGVNREAVRLWRAGLRVPGADMRDMLATLTGVTEWPDWKHREKEAVDGAVG